LRYGLRRLAAGLARRCGGSASQELALSALSRVSSFEQLAELLPVDNEPDKRGIFEKVKDYFM
jgi:hypothetical protein